MLDMLGEATVVALIGLLGGIALGLAARVGKFCTLGAIEDLLYSSDDRRMRMWGLAIGTAIIGAHLAQHLGWLDFAETAYLDRIWSPLGSIFGGLMFGYGMALSGNCGYGALARLGGGDLRAFLVVIVMGISAHVVMSGPLATLRVAVFNEAGGARAPQGISQLMDQAFGVPPLLTGLIAGLGLIALALSSAQMRRARGKILWGVTVGLAVISGWIGTTWVLQHGFAANPVQTHTFAAPIGDTLIYAMTASGTPISFGVGSVLGVVLGACLGSWSKGQFRWEACEDPRELKRQILGAAMMGVGAVLAVGCSIGQGVAAFSLLAYSAPVTFLCILIGAALGLRHMIYGVTSLR